MSLYIMLNNIILYSMNACVLILYGMYSLYSHHMMHNATLRPMQGLALTTTMISVYPDSDYE